ncbi:MAG: hypothetical protein PHN75_11170 [Syntrophales bacterium]|nr:hypothetical protein [Syntrophales bacterium]
MLKKLMNTKTSLVEFLYKFLLVLFFIMPVSIGVCFWIGVQVDALINMHLFKFIMPFIGSAIGFCFTALLVMAGHRQATPTAAEEPAKPSISSAGLATPYPMIGGK